MSARHVRIGLCMCSLQDDISSLSQWASISDAAKDLTQWMLSPNPSDRPSAAEVMAHRWNKQAPVAPLPHVLEGVKHLKLTGFQKLVLQVIEAAASLRMW